MKNELLKKLMLLVFLAVVVPGMGTSLVYAEGSSDSGSGSSDGGGGSSNGVVNGPGGDQFYDIDDDGKYSNGDIPVPKGGNGSGGSGGTDGGGGIDGGGGKSQEQIELEAAMNERNDARTALDNAAGKNEYERREAQERYESAQARVERAAEPLANSASGGDPVLVTSGRYVFEETDLEIPGSGFIVGRRYVTEDGTDGQAGRGWAISLDSRIIRGSTPVDQGRLTEIEGLVAAMRSKAEIQWRYPAARAIGEEITAMYEDALARYTELRAVADRAELLRGLNGLSMYPGTPDYYENTGNETLTLIDEKGVPYLFEYEGGGEWRPADALYRQYMALRSIDGKDAAETSGFELDGRGGVKKRYDRHGQLAVVTEPNGDAVTVSRDGAGKITGISGPHGNGWAVSYSGNRISRISGPEGQAVSYGYEGGGLASVTDRDGDTVRYAYEGGRLKRIVKPDGSYIELTYGYDGADGAKLVSMTRHEEGAGERFDYSTGQRVTTYTNHSGVVTKYWYDEHHRTVGEECGDGTVRTFSYDGDGHLVRETANGNATGYTYDGRGNVAEKRYSDGSRETWAWNGFDQMTRHTDRDGVVTEWAYDAKGNITRIRQGGQVIFTASYDAQGRITESREGARAAYGYTHDARGYIAGRSVTASGETVAEQWKRDALGRVTEYTDGAGRVWKYRYGPRTEAETSPAGLETVWTYNNRKDLVKITERDTKTGAAREQRAEYDRRHLPVRVTDGAGNVTVYTYREDGELVQMRQGAWTRSYGYDAGGRLSSVTRGMDGSADTSVERYSYSQGASGETRSVATGAGTTAYRYDPWGRVTQVTNALGEASTRTLSGAGRVLKEQGASGGNFVYTYDSLGRITGAGKETGTAVRVLYNADGSVAEKTDRNGVVTRYEYDGRGLLSKETSAAGEKRYRYDGAGRVVRAETVTANSTGTGAYYTEWKYSDGTRTVTVTEGGLYSTTWYLNAWGEPEKAVDGTGNGRSWEYDGAGQVVKSRDGYGNGVLYEWNAIGKVEKITYPDGSAERYEYNHLGVVAAVRDALGIRWQGEYDATGRLVREKGRPGIDKEYKYDALGRVVEVKAGGEVTERYAYGERGRTVTFTDGAGNRFVQEKNGYAELVEETDRLGNQQRYGYDNEGRLTQKEAYSGKQAQTGYDDAQGRTTVRYSDGSSAEVVRDLAGNITQVTGETGTVSYRYDAGGKLVWQHDGGAGEKTEYRYDSAGRRTRMISGNRDVNYWYGKNGELLKVFDNSQRMGVAYEYDVAGRETVRTYGNGVKQETQYDAIGRTILIVERDTRREILRAEGYVYDDKGRRTHGVDEQGRITKYEYDSQSRLSAVLYQWTDEKKAADKKEAEEAGLHFTLDKGNGERYSFGIEELSKVRAVLNKASYNRGSLANAHQLLWRETYTYDANGNRATKTNPWGTIRYEYDAENRLVKKGDIAYTYDKDGDLLTEKGAYRTAEYRYNGQNRMAYSDTVDRIGNDRIITEYDYDGFGRRTIVQDTGYEAMRTVYDGLSFEVLREGVTFRDGSLTTKLATGIVRTEERTPGIRYRYLGPESQNGQLQTRRLTETTSSLATRFTGINATLYGNGEAVAVNRLGNAEIRGGASYLGKDALGSVRSRSNEDGQLEDRYEYDAFGKPYKGDLNSGVNLGYTGKPYDTTTGMYNYGYRDYQPEVARFTTIDPIRDGANWFAYVNNDPVNWVDLWGLACSASDYLARGIALVKEGAGKLVAGSVLGSLGEILISGILISDANSKIAEGAQQYTIGTILSEKTLTDKGNVDNYVSPAKGYDAALADFYAINPSNIKIDDKNGTIHGDLLDGTHINVRDHSTYTDDHRPTVEIFISKNYKIKIRY